MDWREENGVRWLQADLPGARAAFTTRLGGVSEGAYSSLNLGVKTEDERERVQENRKRVAAGLGIDPADVLMGHQVHGTELRWHDEPQSPRVYADAKVSPEQVDAHATGSAGLVPLVLVADCLPVALWGPGGVAMAHCGWRPLAGGIVNRTAAAVGATAAAIGPGIGACCYEVGDEVLETFSALPRVANGRMLDLTAVARRLLARAGVEEVESADVCVSCEAELFYSHRRDGARAGRQAGLAWLTGAGGSG
ncbi:MAG: laccase domain-containing protein [Solirubrobacterales bacterium]|nr:laccase domain-containing protein [Solirubrobacterales bacterium]